MAKGKAKEARVEIVLPDGTKVSARGPMAEQMARRLMDPQWTYPYPWYRPAVYGSGALTWATNGDAAPTAMITTTDGAVANATPDQVAQAVANGVNGSGQ